MAKVQCFSPLLCVLYSFRIIYVLHPCTNECTRFNGTWAHVNLSHPTIDGVKILDTRIVAMH